MVIIKQKTFLGRKPEINTLAFHFQNVHQNQISIKLKWFYIFRRLLVMQYGLFFYVKVNSYSSYLYRQYICFLQGKLQFFINKLKFDWKNPLENVLLCVVVYTCDFVNKEITNTGSKEKLISRGHFYNANVSILLHTQIQQIYVYVIYLSINTTVLYWLLILWWTFTGVLLLLWQLNLALKQISLAEIGLSSL